MNIRFFTECNSGSGLGHVARCAKLAVIFMDCGYRVSFFVRGDGDYGNFLSGFPIDASRFHHAPLDWKCINDPMFASDVCVIDSYSVLDLSFFIENCKVLLLFDDDMRFQNLLEHDHLYIVSSSYTADHFSLSGSDRVFNGIEYMPVMPTISHVDETLDFVVCFGGEDSDNLSSTMYDILAGTHLRCAIITGISYQGGLVSTGSCLVCNGIDNARVLNLLASSRNAIVSGGGILIEALNLVDRVGVICTAQNQMGQLNLFQDHINVLDASKLDMDYITGSLVKTNSLRGRAGILSKDMVSSLLFSALNSSVHSISSRPTNYRLDNLLAIDFCNVDTAEAKLIMDCRNHRDVMDNMYSNNPISLSAHLEFIDALRRNRTSKYFLIKQEGKYIGVVSLSRVDLAHRKAYLGIYKNPFISPGVVNGASLGSILLRALKHIAFNEYNLHMLFLEVISSNRRAIRFYEREHFQFVGELPHAFVDRNGNFIDVLVYAAMNDTPTKGIPQRDSH